MTTAVAVVAPIAVLGVVLAVSGVGGTSLLIWSLRLWLFSIGSGLTAAGTNFGGIPVAGLLVSALAAASAARFAVRTVPAEPVVFAAVCGGFAGVVAAVLSVLASIGPGGTSMFRAALGAFAVVGLSVGFELLRRAGEAPWQGDTRMARIVRAAARGWALVLAGAFVLLQVLLLDSIDTAADLWATLGPDRRGAFVLGLLTLAAVPTALGWTVSVLIGPGFSFGVDTHVDLTGVDLGPLPVFPALAALPDPGPFSSWTVSLVALLPVLAAVVVGWTVSMRASEYTEAAIDGALAGGLSGLGLGVFTLLSRGAVGPGTLQTVGPALVTPTLLAVVIMAVGGALGALAAHYRGARGSL